jgi:hypothetical protein
MLSALVTEFVGLLESVVWTVKLKLSDAVGVPDIIPLTLLRERPSGREPEVIDQV